MAGAIFSSNIKETGRLDGVGGGQVYVAGNYAYIGHMKPPFGTSIVDVSDPRKPKIVSQIKLDDLRSHTHKVRVAGDIMITNVEMNERHPVRRAFRRDQAVAKLEAALGRSPTEEEMLADLHIKKQHLELAREFERNPYAEGGFKVWDIADRSNPKLLKHVLTGGIGVHRFDMDENFAYISTEMEGFHGNILVIYDLANPSDPQEVSRWWMPGQHIAGGEKPHWSGWSHRLHHAMRHGDELWAAVWNAGLRIIDIKDISKPVTVGEYNYHPPFPEPSHTFMKVPFQLDGKDVAVVADEEHDHIPGQLHAGLWTFDVSDKSNIKPLGMFHLSEQASPYVNSGRFGMHQFQEHIADTKLFCAWFSGGLRVVDIANPALPKETGFYIPEPRKGHDAPQTNDVDRDDRGLIYLLDRDNGLDIVEYKD